MPQVNRNSSTSGAHTSRMVRWKGERVMSMTRMMAARLNSRLTKLDTTRLMGKINLGTYTFLIRDELPSTLPMPILVLSLKKLNSVLPQMR